MLRKITEVWYVAADTTERERERGRVEGVLVEI